MCLREGRRWVSVCGRYLVCQSEERTGVRVGDLFVVEGDVVTGEWRIANGRAV